jgi:hypothetical protein
LHCVRERQIAELVVVAVVAEDRGELRRFLELVLPLLGEQFVQRFHARRHIRRRRCMRGRRA